MAKAKAVIILDYEFATQKDTENYVRELLCYLESHGVVDSTSEYWPFFCELLARHPDYDEKRGIGILKFLIGRSFQKHIELNLLRLDHTRCDVSWKKCISRRPTSIIGNLKAAMRLEIQSQVDNFKATNYGDGVVCEICNLPLDRLEKSHADHKVHFDILAEKFLLISPDYPKVFDDEAITNKAKFREIDSGFASQWAKFHQDEATLRLVHSECNLRRKKA